MPQGQDVLGRVEEIMKGKNKFKKRKDKMSHFFPLPSPIFLISIIIHKDVYVH